MKKVATNDIESVPHLMGVNSERRPVSREIDGMDFAMVVFDLEPGEAFSGAPHKHFTQEELFYVIDGTVTFECKDEPGGESEFVTVGSDELIRFEPDDVYQTGTNEGDEHVRAVALGVPGARHDWEQTEGLADCTDCGRETAHSFSPTEDATDRRMPSPDEMDITCKVCGNTV